MNDIKGANDMGKNHYKKQPLLYIQQPDTEVPPAYMQRDYYTPRKQENAEAVPNIKPRRRIAPSIDQFHVFTDPVEETGETEQPVDTEEKTFTEEKPFKDMTIKERVAYFVQQTERELAIKCEVRTEHHIYRGIIKDFKDQVVFMNVEKRVQMREIPFEDITHIRMLGF